MVAALTAIAYRPAALDDAHDIFPLLIELAPEIPLLADTLEREEALYARLRNCARSGESWVATDAAGRIVGFLLAEPVEASRHYAEHEVLELRYAGVGKNFRHRGVFAEMLRRAIDRMLPMTASVNPANRFGVADYLQRHGFRPVAAAGGELRLRRDPGTTAGQE